MVTINFNQYGDHLTEDEKVVFHEFFDGRSRRVQIWDASISSQVGKAGYVLCSLELVINDQTKSFASLIPSNGLSNTKRSVEAFLLLTCFTALERHISEYLDSRNGL